jgi:2-deoxy-D-gluconate 3-dehydrogenase
MFRLDNRIALVTGATGSLGRGMADALRDAGARVAVSGRSLAGADDLARAGLTFIPGDIAAPGEASRVVSEAIARMGGLDIVVIAHGITRRVSAEDFTPADWNDTIATNLSSAFECAQAAGRHFLAQGRGKIVFIASMLSFSGGLRCSAYAASKGGVAQLAKALANEWAPRGINVNAIAPGYFESNLTAALQKDPTRNRQILERIPAGRWGRPSDLAGAAVFLSSAASDYVHGTILPVDGGWLAR